MKTTMRSGTDKHVSIANYGSNLAVTILDDVDGEVYVAYVDADELLNAVKAHYALSKKGGS